MSAQPEVPPRHLHIIDGDTGEALEGCPECELLRAQLKGAERDLNGWRARYENLRRDVEAEARADPLWPDGVRLFKLYCRLTGKDGKPRRLAWNAERFALAHPHLKRHGLAMCERAVVGRVFDHFVGQRKNGSPIHYYEWERIFASAKEFEESANRAPLDFVSELEAEDEAKAHDRREEKRRREDERGGQGQLASGA